MTDFGRFRLAYEPGAFDPDAGILDHTVEMTISGEADLPNLLPFFKSFLTACGYIVDGDIKIVPEETYKPKQDKADFWFEDGCSFVGNPYSSPDTLSIGSSGVVGGLFEDVLTLG